MIACVAIYVMLPKPTASTIKIGILSSLTGTEAWIGDGGLNGAQMAVDEINAAGGINNRTVLLISYDDADSAGQVVSLSNRLISDDGVVAAILDDGSEVALPASRVFTNLKVAALVPWAEEADIVGSGYVFRVEQSAVAGGNALGYYVAHALGVKRLAAVVPVDPYEQAYYNAFKAQFENNARAQ